MAPKHTNSQEPKTLDQGIEQYEQKMIERGRQVSSSLPGDNNGLGTNGMGTGDCDDNGGDGEDNIDSDNEKVSMSIDSDDDYNHENYIDNDKNQFSIASSAASTRSLKSRG